MSTTATRYPIPAHPHRVEAEIKRSRFITTIGYTPTPEAARAFIAQVAREFVDANHNCWAYVVGAPGSTGQIGMSDDGEPHGTAGRPMLTVLHHSGIGDVCAVVTRYFGGTLLGKGGLVKAYSGGVQLGLASLPVAERVPTITVDVMIDYTAITLFKRRLPDFEVELLNEEYGVDAVYRLKLPEERYHDFCTEIATLTNGQALVEPDAG